MRARTRQYIYVLRVELEDKGYAIATAFRETPKSLIKYPLSHTPFPYQISFRLITGTSFTTI
jgi:hypothetical protein